MGLREWLLGRRERKPVIPEIPERFLKKKRDGTHYDYYCRKCGLQTNKFEKECSNCGGAYMKTGPLDGDE